jgi:chromosome transmission fidelity protein 8
MIIGHHLLTGRVVKLEKPYAVISKGGNEDQSMLSEDLEVKTDISATSEYTVVAMIKRKVVFKVRPKPIIAGTVSRTQ